MAGHGGGLFAAEITAYVCDMIRMSVLSFFFAVAVTATARGEPSELQQRFACMGDALRLCAQFVPDRDKIRRCMAAQHEALSAGCRPVFDESMRAYSREHPDR